MKRWESPMAQFSPGTLVAAGQEGLFWLDGDIVGQVAYCLEHDQICPFSPTGEHLDAWDDIPGY